jgi:hypothetical protein
MDAFDFERAFGRPVKIINDAAMQAMGSYEGGCMLFLGLGDGAGFYADCEWRASTDGTGASPLSPRPHVIRRHQRPEASRREKSVNILSGVD